MIRVRITPPPGWTGKRIDERGWVELRDGARLLDVLKEIRMPRLVARVFLVSINGTMSKADTLLRDGDSIAFFPIPYGG